MSETFNPHPYASLRKSFGEFADQLEPPPKEGAPVAYKASADLHSFKEAYRNIAAGIALIDTSLELAEQADTAHADAIGEIRGELLGLQQESHILSIIAGQTMELHSLMHDETRFATPIIGDHADLMERLSLYRATFDAAKNLQTMKSLTDAISKLPGTHSTTEQCREACLRVLIPSIEKNADLLQEYGRKVAGEVERSFRQIEPEALEQWLSHGADAEQALLDAACDERPARGEWFEGVHSNAAAPMGNKAQHRQLVEAIHERADSNVIELTFRR